MKLYYFLYEIVQSCLVVVSGKGPVLQEFLVLVGLHRKFLNHFGKFKI